jgi:hypothetical protein
VVRWWPAAISSTCSPKFPFCSITISFRSIFRDLFFLNFYFYIIYEYEQIKGLVRPKTNKIVSKQFKDNRSNKFLFIWISYPLFLLAETKEAHTVSQKNSKNISSNHILFPIKSIKQSKNAQVVNKSNG